MSEFDDLLLRHVASFSQLLGSPVERLDRLGGGGNSQVYRVVCCDGRRFAGKAYFRRPADNRNSLQTEFSALQFLWQQGIRAVPRPLNADAATGYAVYEYIEGERCPADTITASDIDVAVAFLASLDRVKHRPGSDTLGPAAEACFSAKAIVDNLRQRLARLDALPREPESYRLLHEFLDGTLVPTIDIFTEACAKRLASYGSAFDRVLSQDERVLSPSDFGFHNALRRANGEIAFVDFEYFGWDDPAKMVSDFLLHPAMTLSRDLGRRFCEGVFREFGALPHLAPRVGCVYYLFGLKWCLIMLNEFLPADLSRRDFAAGRRMDRGAVQTTQLAKARNMLTRLVDEFHSHSF